CAHDDGKPRSEAAAAEIFQHAANRVTGCLTDAGLGYLRARATSGDTLLVRALDELRDCRLQAAQKSAELAEVLAIFDATWCTEHGHSPKPEQFARIEELRITATGSARSSTFTSSP